MLLNFNLINGFYKRRTRLIKHRYDRGLVYVLLNYAFSGLLVNNGVLLFAVVWGTSIIFSKMQSLQVFIYRKRLFLIHEIFSMLYIRYNVNY